MDDGMMINKKTGEVFGSQADYTCYKGKFEVNLDHKITCFRGKVVHALNGVDILNN